MRLWVVAIATLIQIRAQLSTEMEAGDCALEDLELRRDLADLFVVCFKG